MNINVEVLNGYGTSIVRTLVAFLAMRWVDLLCFPVCTCHIHASLRIAQHVLLLGLGKTIQIICFLEGLRISKKGGPVYFVRSVAPCVCCVVLLCTLKVLLMWCVKWMTEFQKWAPEFRVMLMHDSGQHSSSDSHLIERVKSPKNRCGSVIITTYTTLKLREVYLLPVPWGLVILD